VSKPYVFVVDDDEVVRENICKKLSRLQCRVRSFDSGEALLEFLPTQSHEPDVILLDYKMRGMDGVETLQVVRKSSSVPAVIFTAYSGSINAQEIKNLGHCEVMIKTVDLHMLDSVVQGVVAVKEKGIRTG
jgi:CheY-like chemotaxis protein